MKNFSRYVMISFILISIIIATGCTTTPSPTNEITPITTSLHVSNTTSITPIASPTTTSTPIVLTTTQITTEDLGEHFMDVSFGIGSNYLYRFNHYSNPNRQDPNLAYFSVLYPKGSDAKETDSQLLQNFLISFNRVSRTVKFREKIGGQNDPIDFGLNFVSSNDFKNIDDKYAIIQHNGVIYAKSQQYGGIYINKSLEGDERNYTIIRSFLYGLGFRGESLKYKDSIFYIDNTNNSNLSFVDLKAIEIMYGPGMYTGMTKEYAREIVFVK